jgi:hypothetical protein
LRLFACEQTVEEPGRIAIAAADPIKNIEFARR